MSVNQWTNPIQNWELARHFNNVKYKGMTQKDSAQKLGRDDTALAMRLGWRKPEMRDRKRVQDKINKRMLSHQKEFILASDRSKCWITGVEFTPENLAVLSQPRAVLPDLEHCKKRNAFRGWTFSKLNTAMGNVGDDPKLVLRLAGYLRQHHFNAKWYDKWHDKRAAHRPLYAECRRIYAMYDSCQNCGYVPPAGAVHCEKLTLDHHHPTGMVRGVLCSGCNAAEGFFTKVADYLGMKVEKLLELSAEYLRRELPC